MKFLALYRPQKYTLSCHYQGIPGAKRNAFSEKLVDSYDGVTTAYEAYLKGAEIAGKVMFSKSYGITGFSIGLNCFNLSAFAAVHGFFAWYNLSKKSNRISLILKCAAHFR